MTPAAVCGPNGMETHQLTQPVQPRRRGGVACRRCRRLRAKCVHQGAQPPCQACRTAGSQTAGECSFPQRGEKDLDREFRRRRPRAEQEDAADVPARRRTPAAEGRPGPEERDGGADVPAPSADRVAGNRVPPPAGHTGPAVPAASPRICVGDQAGRRGGGHGGCEQPGHRRRELPKPGLAGDHDLLEFPPLRDRQQDIPPGWVRLPPHDEIVQGCRVFITSYFQLGFTPKTVFVESVSGQQWEDSVSRFLLVCILGISARFTPALVRRYGSPSKATEIFMAMASRMVPTEMYQPSLERIQAFFLLAIAEWGNGEKDRSSVHMAIAVRMASILKLHREETYRLPPDAPADEVVRSESARRTFWMIQSQENLHSGHNTPTPFSPDEITTYLPSNESDFAFGVVPSERAALPGTPPALADPSLVFSPGRSLFATLVQAHSLWGHVARRACRPDQSPGQRAGSSPAPWDEHSEFHGLVQTLQQWEDNMPARHRWSAWNLRGWKAESLHLAYLSVVMVLRLSNIVIRRIYLEDLISVSSPPITGAAPSPSPPPHDFWPSVSHSLFANVAELHEQIDAYFSSRAPDEGFPAILVFCVYVCGSLASYLWRYPRLCPGRAPAAAAVALRSLEVLTELQSAWPAAVRWQQGLRQAQAASAATAAWTPGREPGGETGEKGGKGEAGCESCGARVSGATEARSDPGLAVAPGEITTATATATATRDHYGGEPGPVAEAGVEAQVSDLDGFPNEWFDAELAAFLHGDVHFGPWVP